MGDALGTYFEGRASLRTESPSLESGGITRAGMAIAKACYDTLRKYGKAAIAEQVWRLQRLAMIP